MTTSYKYSIFRIIIFTMLLCSLFVGSQASAQKKDNLKLNTVVIDAGHGGHDPGCVSKDRTVMEKTLTLSIAKRFAAKVRDAYPDVKVVLTRDTDEFIELNERAAIANRNNANLFVSIHINTSPSSTSANGFSIHILGQSSQKNRDLFSYNMDVCKRENSVIMLEDNYSTKYQGFDPSSPESFIFFNLMQNAFLEQSFLFAQDVDEAMSHGPIRVNRGIWQDPFYVLWKTSMPSALVECGFMSNSSDREIMTSDEGQDGIANDLLKAFTAFKRSYDNSVSLDGSRNVEQNLKQINEKQEKPDSSIDRQVKETGKSQVVTTAQENHNEKPNQDIQIPSEDVYYGTQILATTKTMSTNDKCFKGFKPMLVTVGRMKKYVIGTAPDLDGATKQYQHIKKLFQGSFMVKVENGTTSIIK